MYIFCWKTNFSVAAPNSPEVFDFFMGLGLVLLDRYGSSETMTIATSCLLKPGYFKLGTVGKVI